MTEEGVRHVFLEVGATTVLHPFQILEGPALPSAPGTMFQRGRLHHFAFWALPRRRFGVIGPYDRMDEGELSTFHTLGYRRRQDFWYWNWY
jgi:hypothetical protein